jgi:hypothetical protein
MRSEGEQGGEGAVDAMALEYRVEDAKDRRRRKDNSRFYVIVWVGHDPYDVRSTARILGIRPWRIREHTNRTCG